MTRRRVLAAAGYAGLAALTGGAVRAQSASAGIDIERVRRTVSQAASWPDLHNLLVAHQGRELVVEHYRGPGPDQLTNVKSVAKTVMAAVTGAAIDHGVLEGVDQRVAPLLGDLVPADADERVDRITVDHLLTMRAGLERTSGPNYGRWVTSSNWVRHALSRPFVAEPGGRMLYSTGSYHLLSAALTRASGRSTLALTREWLGEPLGIEIPPWDTDPQGFYFGGNNMALTPQALLRLGETYRRQGVYGGERVLSEDWVQSSWIPRTRSFFTGHRYGYGWFVTAAGRRPVYYAWGYGGQMIHVVPDVALTAVMTSDPGNPSGRSGYARNLHGLVADLVSVVDA